MLLDEGLQHIAALLLVTVATDAATTPRNLFPHQETQLVAQLQHQWSLLVMTQTYEIRAHILDGDEGLANDLIWHGRSHAGVVFMVVRALEE